MHLDPPLRQPVDPPGGRAAARRPAGRFLDRDHRRRAAEDLGRSAASARTHKRAAAIACYADSGRDLDRLIDEETKAAGVTIAPDARAALRKLIGSDRLVSRSEIGKLCLYAADGGTISIDDVAR